jgi:hypothetical protein
MSQAILTKYLDATDHRGARILAKAQAGKVTVPWDHAFGVEDNHALAAVALCTKFGWTGPLAQGSLPDDTGYAFTFVSKVREGARLGSR